MLANIRVVDCCLSTNKMTIVGSGRCSFIVAHSWATGSPHPCHQFVRLCEYCNFFSLALFTLPFACRDTAPVLRTLLCVKVSDAEKGEILLQRWSVSGGSIRAALLVNCPSVNKWPGGAEQGRVCLTSLITTQVLHSTKYKATLQDQTKVTVTVFGNLYEENKYHSCTWKSICPHVCPPACPIDSFRHFSARKTASDTDNTL